jgi:hypothetical protein
VQRSREWLPGLSPQLELGSVVARGRVVVARGRIVVARGRVVVARGHVVVARDRVVVALGRVVVAVGRVVVAVARIVVAPGCIAVIGLPGTGFEEEGTRTRRQVETRLRKLMMMLVSVVE